MPTSKERNAGLAALLSFVDPGAVHDPEITGHVAPKYSLQHRNLTSSVLTVVN